MPWVNPVLSPTRPPSPVRPLRLIRIPSTTRRRVSIRAIKETDVKTPVPIIMILAAVAIHMYIPCMAEGIRFARSWPAIIAGCVAALDIADINILRSILLRNKDISCKEKVLSWGNHQQHCWSSHSYERYLLSKRAYTNYGTFVNPKNGSNDTHPRGNAWDILFVPVFRLIRHAKSCFVNAFIAHQMRP